MNRFEEIDIPAWDIEFVGTARVTPADRRAWCARSAMGSFMFMDTGASAAGAEGCTPVMGVLEPGLEEKSSEGESEAPDELELEVTLSLRGCWMKAEGSKRS